MPALVMFRRKWLIAGDDLVFPFVLESIWRTILIFATGSMIWVQFKHQNGEDNSQYTAYFLYVLLVDFLLTAPLCAILSWYSAQGSAMEVDERKFLPKIIYLKILTVHLDLLLAVSGAWLGFYKNIDSNINPEVNTYVQVIVIGAGLYFFVILISVIFAYSPLGSSKFWQSKNSENCPNISSKFLKKAEKTWTFRLKFMCCWLGINKTNHSIYKEIATFLASFFKDTDLVPSDIFAGLVILSKKHASERRKLKFMDSLCSHGYISSNDDLHPTWMTVENALYFLRLSKSTYGWLMLFDSCNPYTLASQTRCCGLFAHVRDIDGTDDCCNCNIVALQKASGFTADDLVYVSYENSIYEPAFFVVIDKKKSAIVIGIRGTLSLSDLVTDIDAGSEKVCLENPVREFYCHRGTLRSTQYIQKKLTDLNILKIAFAEYPDFGLVITGHSLGGSVGALLGLFLRSEYPNVQCYAYGPLATLSCTAAKLTQDFTLSVVVGDDMTPRLCVSACLQLRLEIIKSLEECQIQKYKLMMNALSKFLFKKKLFRALNFPKNVNTIRQNSVQSIEVHIVDWLNYKENHLYAPGRILYMEETFDGTKAFWKTGFHFHRLIVSPKMFIDHRPRTIQIFLERVRDQAMAESSAATNLAYSPSPQLDKKHVAISLHPSFVI